MQKLIEEYQNNWIDYHPVVRATLLHGEFVKIHPFIEKNVTKRCAQTSII